MHLPATLLTGTALLAQLAYSNHSDPSSVVFYEWDAPEAKYCNAALNNIEGCTVKGPPDSFIGVAQGSRCVNGSLLTGTAGSVAFSGHGACNGSQFSWYWINNWPHFTYQKATGEKYSLANISTLELNATNTVDPVAFTPSPTPTHPQQLTFGNANADGTCVVNLMDFKGFWPSMIGPMGVVKNGKCNSGGGITTGSFLMGDIHATLYWSWSGGWPNLAFYDHRAHENYTIGGIENLKIGATNYIYAAHSASVSASTTTASSTPYPSPTMDTGGGRVRPPIRGGPEIPPFQGGEGPKV